MRDWYDREVTLSSAAEVRQQARWDRITAEVAEMRDAARRIRESGVPACQQIAHFVDNQAHILHAANTMCAGVDLDPTEDTRDHPDYRDSPARSALLIARGFTAGT